jgi:hypothetical protein
VRASRAASIGLVVDPRQRRNRFGRYAGEILRAEGIGDFEELDLAQVTLEALRRFGVVVLTSCGPVPGLPETLAEYVEAGGRLVLLQPALELAPFLGLQPLWHSRPGTSVLVDSRSPVFGGFPYEPIQVIGPVDLYRAVDDGLRVIARTVAGDWPAEPYPAVVERAAGRGRVLAFLYDPPHTVARLRQGDPTLAECDTDGLVGVRPSDAVQWQIETEPSMARSRWSPSNWAATAYSRSLHRSGSSAGDSKIVLACWRVGPIFPAIVNQSGGIVRSGGTRSRICRRKCSASSRVRAPLSTRYPCS